MVRASTDLQVLTPRASELPWDDFPSATILVVPRTTLYQRWVKRPFDVVVATLALVVLSPVIALVAASIPVLLGQGGIVYRQQRIGRGGQPFTIYKFRSMLRDRRERTDPHYIGPERRLDHKSLRDPRHTRYGRFLRATSLDELPQLVNVIRGEMSLVGPRPELVTVAEQGRYVDHPRHIARPGVTGAFQVSPLRATNRISAGLALDIDYVTRVQFRRDAEILLRTMAMLLARRGS